MTFLSRRLRRRRSSYSRRYAPQAGAENIVFQHLLFSHLRIRSRLTALLQPRDDLLKAFREPVQSHRPRAFSEVRKEPRQSVSRSGRTIFGSMAPPPLSVLPSLYTISRPKTSLLRKKAEKLPLRHRNRKIIAPFCKKVIVFYRSPVL